MTWTWALAAASLVGVVLNIRKDRRCYAIWFVTNGTWSAVDLSRGLPAQAALQMVYVGLSVWGWVKWK